MLHIELFRPEFYEMILSFLSQILPLEGRTFEPDGRHSFILDIPGNFLSFNCLFDDDILIGTSALKPLDKVSCELKCVYLSDKYRGLGLGEALVMRTIAEAKALGFEKIFLDTISKTSQAAIRLYRRLGFTETQKYNDSPFSDVFMMLSLH